MTMQNAERMLTDQPVPPPPVGLIEDIKAEIPDNIEIHPALLESTRVVPWHKRRNLRLAVAAVFVVTLTAVVSWQMRKGPILVPDHRVNTADPIVVEPLLEEPGQIESVTTPATEPEPGGPRDADEDVPGPPESTTREITEAQASVEHHPARSREIRESQVIDAQSADDRDGEVLPENLNLLSDQVLPDPGIEYGDAEVTDEMIEQDMERSFEGEVTVTGSVIPRADLTTAVSPVVDAAPVGGSSKTPPSDPGTSRSIGGQSVSDGEEIEYGITDAMIEHAMERSFEGEVTVTGSTGQRSGRLSATNWRRQWTPKASNSNASAPREKRAEPEVVAPSTGGTEEPNDQPYGDVFFREYGVNPFIDTEDDRFSTFGLEVDTGSYNVVRRYLRDGHLPPREAVRVEEIINAFDYGDQAPTEAHFGLTAVGAPSPFADGPRYQILRFGVTTREVGTAERPAAVLTFVIDVSGSMDRGDRLGLVKRALYELLGSLREDDRVGLVTYGSRGEVVLEPSTDHEAIRSAIGRLVAGGSTNAEEGLVLAYELADHYRDNELINRVILCSDGVANVGNTSPESILGRIKTWADNGIELTTVGFGMGNYNDALMEQLADTGDGRYAYIDTFDEARRLFVEELTGTLFTLGSEAKAQVEFNADVVSRYRLIGYENRDIADERFRDPTVDAGEIGAGHTATAVYEVKLTKSGKQRDDRVLATLRVRFRPPGSDVPVEIEKRLKILDLERSWDRASPGLKLATLVAEYAEILKGSYWAKEGDMAEVLRRAQERALEFEGNERISDWIELVEAAAELIGETDDKSIEITD